MKSPASSGTPSSEDIGRHPIVAALVRETEELMKRTPAAGLYIVATPIGNLADSSLRMIWILAKADLVYCEDTRHTRGLLTRFGIGRELRAYHDHSDVKDRQRVIEQLDQGRSIALISDAGTPLVSDPGFKLVRDALEAGHPVFAVPGPSAVLAALAISGLATDSFVFGGFLPQKQKARRERLVEFADWGSTLVFFEAPTRLQDTLLDMMQAFGDRSAVVAREITKLNEELRKGLLSELADWAGSAAVKGEVTLVVAGAAVVASVSDQDIEAALGKLLETKSVRDAVQDVSIELQIPRGRVYGLARRMSRRDSRGDA